MKPRKMPAKCALRLLGVQHMQAQRKQRIKISAPRCNVCPVAFAILSTSQGFLESLYDSGRMLELL